MKKTWIVQQKKLATVRVQLLCSTLTLLLCHCLQEFRLELVSHEVQHFSCYLLHMNFMKLYIAVDFLEYWTFLDVDLKNSATECSDILILAGIFPLIDSRLNWYWWRFDGIFCNKIWGIGYFSRATPIFTILRGRGFAKSYWEVRFLTFQSLVAVLLTAFVIFICLHASSYWSGFSVYVPWQVFCIFWEDSWVLIVLDHDLILYLDFLSGDNVVEVKISAQWILLVVKNARVQWRGCWRWWWVWCCIMSDDEMRWNCGGGISAGDNNIRIAVVVLWLIG